MIGPCARFDFSARWSRSYGSTALRAALRATLLLAATLLSHLVLGYIAVISLGVLALVNTGRLLALRRLAHQGVIGSGDRGCGS